MGSLRVTQGTVLESLRDLESRVQTLESKWREHDPRIRMNGEMEMENDSINSRAVSVVNGSKDVFGVSMLIRAIAKGFTQTQFVRCQEDYYEQTLEWRRRYLGAPHVAHLTKSIVLDNKNLKKDDPSRHVCCVIPYGNKIDPDSLQSLLSKHIGISNTKKANFRLAEDCVQLTGYVPNAVTPLGILTPMPVVLDQRIHELEPNEFWLGGGEVSLKWQVVVPEFVRVFQPFIGKVSVPE